MVRHVLVAVAAIVVLAGCSAAAPAPAAAPSSPTASTPVTQHAAVQASTAAKPLSYYAAQYERIIAPSNAAVKRMQAVPSTDTFAQAQPDIDAYVTTTRAAATALIRAQWPNAQTVTDARAEAAAFDALASDLSSPNPETSQTTHDSGIANAAAQVVRADLGLPAAVG